MFQVRKAEAVLAEHIRGGPVASPHRFQQPSVARHLSPGSEARASHIRLQHSSVLRLLLERFTEYILQHRKHRSVSGRSGTAARGSPLNILLVILLSTAKQANQRLLRSA